MSFHDLIPHIFPVLSNSPLSGWIGLFLYPLKGILVAPKSYQLRIKLLQTSMCGFCVDRSFQLFWVNSQEQGC